MLKDPIRNEEILDKDGFYITYTVPYTISQNLTDYWHIFCALYDCELVKVSEYHEAASGVAATLQVLKLVGTATTTALLTTAFNLQSTALTPVIKSRADMVSDTRLKPGERLMLNVSAASLSGFRNCQLTFYFKYIGRGEYKY